MNLEVLSGTTRTGGIVSTPLERPVVVLVTNPAGLPIKNAPVRIWADVPDSIAFDEGNSFAFVRTNADGQVAVRLTPLEEGTLKYWVRAGDGAGPLTVECTIEVTDMGVRRVGGGVLLPAETDDGDPIFVRDRGIQPPPRRRRRTPVII